MRQIAYRVVDCCWMIGIVLLGALMTLIIGI
jgi:hypothetical protein